MTKITSKGQATIPSRVRKLLGVKAGDSVMFTIDGDKVTLRRAEKLDAGFLKLATDSFSDWNTPEADEAFRDL
ncbi:MAG: AbrB/MazE/SpoVT family DNA-binding domain-containing protein [Alphaproteobacteria bacterium]